MISAFPVGQHLHQTDRQCGQIDRRALRPANAGEPQNPSWIQTVRGKGWFTLFRFYGPLEPFFDNLETRGHRSIDVICLVGEQFGVHSDVLLDRLRRLAGDAFDIVGGPVVAVLAVQ